MREPSREQLRCSNDSTQLPYAGLALTALAALCIAIRVVAAGAAGPGQGRHLGEEKKSHGDEGEQSEQRLAAGRDTQSGKLSNNLTEKRSGLWILSAFAAH